jgi:hypothetical protein
VLPWAEGHAAEAHWHVDLAGGQLGALAGVGAEGLDPDVQAAQRLGVADGAVHHQPGPPVGLGQPGDQVAHERGVQRAAAVHHQHGAAARLGQDLLDQRVVLEAGHRPDRPVKAPAPTELPQLQVAALQRLAVLVDQVGRAEVHGQVPQR